MKMAKNRLTRNSFKRKIIVFGVAIFMSVAMMATGFAAWVISTNAKAEGTVGVDVATIERGNLTIEMDETLFASTEGGAHKDKLTFGPDGADTEGYLKAETGSTDTENLSVKIKGVVKNIENLGKLTLTVDLSAFAAAIEANYIELDMEHAVETIAEGVAHTYIYTIDIGDGSDYYHASGSNADFDIDLKLKWGSAFGNKNPGYYFDEDVDFSTTEDADILNTIESVLTAFNEKVGGKTIKVTVLAEVA
ncbi:MAG: hypothetical protein IJA15_04810 [Clostridia bacterium]|nr:hypothetical protein [Clostridia bacterium]